MLPLDPKLVQRIVIVVFKACTTLTFCGTGRPVAVKLFVHCHQSEWQE